MHNTPKKFTKKPVTIEAVQWDGYAETVNEFVGEAYGTDWWYESKESTAIIIPTLEGEFRCKEKDWIIKGIKGEVYVCRADVFDATYTNGKTIQLDPKTIICFKDGEGPDNWCATYGDFQDLQASSSWWGSDPVAAVEALVNMEE